jgi:hypothetical protein
LDSKHFLSKVLSCSMNLINTFKRRVSPVWRERGSEWIAPSLIFCLPYGVFQSFSFLDKCVKDVFQMGAGDGASSLTYSLS